MFFSVTSKASWRESMSPRNNDDLNRSNHAPMMQPPVTQDVRERAAKVLRAMYDRDELAPVEGWHWGSTLDAYMDILGLNGRPPHIPRPLG